MTKNLLLGTALAAGTMIMAAMPAHAEGNKVWTGVSVMEDSYYAYIGGVKAFNDDLDTDGFLMRASFGFGGYEYDTVAVAGGEVEGDQMSGDIMIGYQWVGDTDRFAIYVGGSIEDHDLEPSDPNNGVNGSEGPESSRRWLS
ncbi:MAG: cellulose biosynthesis protein BcsS [Parvibaculaceae bacterium]|nr:cellulose biosynthesis protein BcsS [Parvibaculaceae bacterium]